MRGKKTIVAIAMGSMFMIPAQAFAVGDGNVVVPDWLSIAAVGFGLATAVLLLAGSILLKQVSQGSSIADNMTYIMSGAICIAASMLARWAVLFWPDGVSPDIVTLSSDLLLTAGMALFTAYFFRVRSALLAFMKMMKQGVSDNGEV
ncbi:MAG: hypothetical protein PF636_02630 [Actinomycetota bacterium]|jgi:drug/metabolite transporter (DMT)-like permease|nr:hypothetical protein [Actinomycetota bacterium]